MQNLIRKIASMLTGCRACAVNIYPGDVFFTNSENCEDIYCLSCACHVARRAIVGVVEEPETVVENELAMLA